MNIIHRSDTHDTEAVEYTADHVSEVDDKFPISGDLPLPLISIIKKRNNLLNDLLWNISTNKCEDFE